MNAAKTARPMHIRPAASRNTHIGSVGSSRSIGYLGLNVKSPPAGDLTTGWVEDRIIRFIGTGSLAVARADGCHLFPSGRNGRDTPTFTTYAAFPIGTGTNRVSLTRPQGD